MHIYIYLIPQQHRYMQGRLIFWKYSCKQVFCLKKLIIKERNPQKITAPKESVNK